MARYTIVVFMEPVEITLPATSEQHALTLAQLIMGHNQAGLIPTKYEVKGASSTEDQGELDGSF